MELAEQEMPVLLDIASTALSKESDSEETEPGNRKDTLTQIVDYLTPVVAAKRLSLPQISEGSQHAHSLVTIYQGEFENLP